MTTSVPDVSALDSKALENELATLAAHLTAGTCRWLELVAELDRRGEWQAWGARSCAHWLAWRCALDPRSAREHVRVARRLGELPQIHASFACGELSYAKVRALARVATEETEEELLVLARAMTAAQLDRTVAAYRRVTTREARDAQDRAYLSVDRDDDGSVILHGRLAPEDGELFVRALEAMRDAIWKRGNGPAGPRPAHQASRAEALVALADAALARPEAEQSGAERYQVVVHVDEGVLADGEEGACALEAGVAVAPETARRLACDASVVRSGRKTRVVPPRMRRALRLRDQGCRFPGCENRRFLDAHHVRHWAKGGATKLDNLLLLCRRHHRLVHECGYTVDADGRFYYPWGGAFAAVPTLPRGDPDELVSRHHHLAIDEATCRPGLGEPCNRGDAVDWLFEIERWATRPSGCRTLSG